MLDKPIIWRGSVTDLATDIAAELTAEQLQGLVTALGKWCRLNQPLTSSGLPRCADCGMVTPPGAMRQLHHIGCGAGAPR